VYQAYFDTYALALKHPATMFNLKTTKELVSFLVKKQITANQLFFCHLIYSQDIESLSKYVHEFRQFDMDEIHDLEDRGYIINQDYHNKSFYADMFMVTERLLDGLDLVDEKLGLELWQTYPNFIVVNSSQVPAKSTDKDELVKIYLRKVSGIAQHKMIISLLEKAKSANMVTMGIRKWVDSAQWETLEEYFKSNPTEKPHYGEQEF
jgi:hypothetical protein